MLLFLAPLALRSVWRGRLAKPAGSRTRCAAASAGRDSIIGGYVSHYAAGSFGLVGDDSADDLWDMVRSQIQAEKRVSDFDIQFAADAGVFDLSGERRHGLPAADADTGVFVYFYRGRVDDI